MHQAAQRKLCRFFIFSPQRKRDIYGFSEQYFMDYPLPE